MGKIKPWILAARPHTLPFGAAPALVGSAYAYQYGYFSWSTFLMCLFAAIFLQVGANYANDVFDFKKGADTEERVGPVRAVASGLLTAKKMQQGMIAAFCLAFIIGAPVIYQVGLVLALLFFVSVLVAMGYSGGPSPLAYLGLGEATNLVFMAGIPTLLMCFVQTGKFLPEAIVLGLCFGGLTSGVMCMNNLRDEVTDRESGKGTLVVRLGNKFGKAFFAFLMIYPYVLPCVLVIKWGLPFSICGVIALIIPTIPVILNTMKAKRADEYAAIFPKVALLALVYMITLSCGLIL